MSLKKIKTIAKAFIEPLPEEEDWYQSRLKICGGCEYNTANIDSSKLTIADKLKRSSGLCDNGNHCQACGCCVERKCATKSEDCGLVKLELEPKWVALEVPSTINKGISLVNLSPELGTILAEKASFSYTFDGVESNRLSFNFEIKRDHSKLKIKNYRPSCACISVDAMDKVDANTFNFNVAISTIGFRKGFNERKLFVTYFERGNMTREIMIIFKVNMLNGK